MNVLSNNSFPAWHHKQSKIYSPIKPVSKKKTNAWAQKHTVHESPLTIITPIENPYFHFSRHDCANRLVFRYMVATILKMFEE